MIDLKKDIKKLLSDQCFYEQRINMIQGKIKNMKEIVLNTRDLKGMTYEGVLVQTSNVSDETSNKAMKILDIMIPDIDDELEELKRMKELKKVIDALMELLSEDERIIIELRYGKHMKWREIARKTSYHMSHGPKVNDKAIEKMERFLLESDRYYQMLTKNKIGVR